MRIGATRTNVFEDFLKKRKVTEQIRRGLSHIMLGTGPRVPTA
jgi:hypothetical protein